MADGGGFRPLSGSCGRNFEGEFERRRRRTAELVRAEEVADFRFSGGAERLNLEDFCHRRTRANTIDTSGCVETGC